MKKVALVLFLLTSTVHAETMAAATTPSPHATANPCNPSNLFKDLTPNNFIAAVSACEQADIASAIALAQATPEDALALSCLMPLQAVASSNIQSGLMTALEAFRKAKMSGFIANCAAWAASISTIP